MGCNDELLLEHGVTESNMMQYLGIIEQRTIEVLKMYEVCETKGSFDTHEETKGIPPQERPMIEIKIETPDTKIIQDVPDIVLKA